jgi:hypothetical protein
MNYDILFFTNLNEDDKKRKKDSNKKTSRKLIRSQRTSIGHSLYITTNIDELWTVDTSLVHFSQPLFWEFMLVYFD